MQKVVVLTKEQIEQQLRSITHQIVGRNSNLEDVALVGIRTGGAFLAYRIRDMVNSIYKINLPVGVLDITLYRDDWSRIGPVPKVGKTEIPFPIDDKVVILVDDVLFTGRTIRAAMDALMDMGRPKRIQVAVLVDRGENSRELPIVANFVGITLDVSLNQRINVYLKEKGFEDQVVIEGE